MVRSGFSCSYFALCRFSVVLILLTCLFGLLDLFSPALRFNTWLFSTNVNYFEFHVHGTSCLLHSFWVWDGSAYFQYPLLVPSAPSSEHTRRDSYGPFICYKSHIAVWNVLFQSHISIVLFPHVTCAGTPAKHRIDVLNEQFAHLQYCLSMSI